MSILKQEIKLDVSSTVSIHVQTEVTQKYYTTVITYPTGEQQQICFHSIELNDTEEKECNERD